MTRSFVIAITGASGAIYGARLVEYLTRLGRNLHLTISSAGSSVLEHELGVKVDLRHFQPNDFLKQVTDSERYGHVFGAASPRSEVPSSHGTIHYHHYGDFLAPIASGSFLTGGMVVCPCSGGTLSAIVSGASANLVQRAADVHLKERRTLVLVPRETPLSLVQLDNMKRACQAGAVVLPASPGWYHGSTSAGGLVDFVVSRVLDQLGIENSLIERWGKDGRKATSETTTPDAADDSI